jgi:hypothetical protein
MLSIRVANLRNATMQDSTESRDDVSPATSSPGRCQFARDFRVLQRHPRLIHEYSTFVAASRAPCDPTNEEVT